MAEPARQIRPRTDDERRAYLTGYANAIEIVIEHGLREAQAHLRLLVEAEGIHTEVEDETNSH